MVAFVVSTLIGIVIFIVPYRWGLKNRPVGASLTWGEAMVASIWVFFVLFWWYGVVPHQWLTLADNELGWRSDKLLRGWGFDPAAGKQGIVERALPFEMNWLIIRDIIAVGIYGVALGGNIAVWGHWQKRGKAKPGSDVAVSGYGRPLVKPGATS